MILQCFLIDNKIGKELNLQEETNEGDSLEAAIKFHNNVLQNLEKFKKEAYSFYEEEYKNKLNEKEVFFRKTIEKVSFYAYH